MHPVRMPAYPCAALSVLSWTLYLASSLLCKKSRKQRVAEDKMERDELLRNGGTAAPLAAIAAGKNAPDTSMLTSKDGLEDPNKASRPRSPSPAARRTVPETTAGRASGDTVVDRRDVAPHSSRSAIPDSKQGRRPRSPSPRAAKDSTEWPTAEAPINPSGDFSLWYLTDSSEKRGPLSLTVATQHVDQGRIATNTRVCATGMRRWCVLGHYRAYWEAHPDEPMAEQVLALARAASLRSGDTVSAEGKAAAQSAAEDEHVATAVAAVEAAIARELAAIQIASTSESLHRELASIKIPTAVARELARR